MAKELEQIDVAAANAAKLKALQATMDKIEKDFGKGAIMKLGDRPEGDVSVIPSGSIALDHALGIGGYPRGRVPGAARRMRGVRARNSPWRLQWTRIVPLPRMGKRTWASCSG